MSQSKSPAMPEKDDPPEALSASVDAARSRTLQRRHGPPIGFKRDESGSLIRDGEGAPIWDWPYADGEYGSEPWFWLVLDAFGTRNPTVAAVFINYLLKLVETTWDAEQEQWVPDDGQLQAILHVVSAHKPKNEMQAAMAAERAATTLLTMKLADRVAKYPHDHKTVASYARLAIVGAVQTRAYLETQGKRKSSVQKINVRRENHVHYHDHRPAGGSGESGNQPHAQGTRISTLPCADAGGEVVLLPCRERADSLSDARRSKRVGRTEG